MNRLLCSTLLASFLVTPLAATRTIVIHLPENPLSQQPTSGQKHLKFVTAVAAGTAVGCGLGALVEYIFRNQTRTGLKWGGISGFLIGARIGAEAYGPQNSMLWHDIINLVARLMQRVDNGN